MQGASCVGEGRSMESREEFSSWEMEVSPREVGNT